MSDCESVVTAYLIGVECTAFLAYAMWVRWKTDLGAIYFLGPPFWPILVPIGLGIFAVLELIDLTSTLKKISSGPRTLSISSSLAAPYTIYVTGKGHRFYIDSNGKHNWV